MSKFKDLMELALEQAVQRHFCQLFEVLMVRSDEQAVKRFKNGLEKLAKVDAEVGAMIAGTE